MKTTVSIRGIGALFVPTRSRQVSIATRLDDDGAPLRSSVKSYRVSSRSCDVAEAAMQAARGWYLERVADGTYTPRFSGNADYDEVRAL